MAVLSFSTPATRLRVLITYALQKLGFREDSFLLLMAILVGIITAAAAVGFHELIVVIRDLLYTRDDPEKLYGRDIWLLILFPAVGGLCVSIVSRLLHAREGHGVVDVMESVVRSSGFQKPLTAIEKILTSGLTIGSGGSAGAEGPIVQIGAAIASGVGRLFRLARHHMPILTGCGCAAGISAIFNAPFGGVLFTLEVILQDFSIRAFTPIVVSSVVAQVSVRVLFQGMQHLSHSTEPYHAIFSSPTLHEPLEWPQVGNFVLLGLICGFAGLALTRLLHYTETQFKRIRVAPFFRPALGGALVGVLGVLFVAVFGRLMFHQLKPFPFSIYPAPAFYSDSYGVIQQLLVGNFNAYTSFDQRFLALLVCLIALKIVATCLTLSSGGSGGIIAPSLFIGAASGATLGMLLKHTHRFAFIHPEVYALVGMGAALAAVVHAPLASILICCEVTQDYDVMLPAMLACVVATGTARYFFPDSVYTMSLRTRGIRMGGAADMNLLRRLNVEQVTLEPATRVRIDEPFQRVLDLTLSTGAADFVVVDCKGIYTGMIISDDIKTVLLEREAIPLLTCGDLARSDLPVVHNTDDLATAFDAFTQYDVTHLPVVIGNESTRVIGLISRAGLIRRYQSGLMDQ